jgi:hypothetical protein
MQHRAKTHRTRLKRDIQRGAGQAVVLYRTCRRSQRNNFSMRSRIVIYDRTIKTCGKELSVGVQQNGAHGDFTEFSCLHGLR